MLYAFCAGGSLVEIVVEVVFDGFGNGALRTSIDADAKFFEELDGATSHAATDHHIGFTLFDETWDLADFMAG